MLLPKVRKLGMRTPMADKTLAERLQPSLLDRLTDNDPGELLSIDTGTGVRSIVADDDEGSGPTPSDVRGAALDTDSNILFILRPTVQPQPP